MDPLQPVGVHSLVHKVTRYNSMNTIDDVNRVLYLDEEICDTYQNLKDLFAVERVLIDHLSTIAIPGGKILDIGVGAGRTTRYLLQVSTDYVGIDYSSQMVALAKRNCPDVNILECDARDLSRFSDQEFGLVFVAFNGLDYVSHSDRLTALCEIVRVLKPAGIFVFSSHNRDYEHYNKLRVKYREMNPQRLWRLLIAAKNRLGHWRQNVHKKSYAIITDPAHNYQLLTYYISSGDQKEQLEAVGFSKDVTVFDLQGRIVTNAVPTAPECSWLYYLATKQ